MPTRYITIVIDGKKPRIAQYGHFDGSPYTNGIKILKLLRRDTEQRIRTQLNRCVTLEELEYRKFYKGSHLDEEALEKAHPKFWWADGADMLEMLLDEERTVETCDYYNFAFDSIQCEWGYVIDYDEQVFEVYKGWSRKPIKPEERFYNNGNLVNDSHPIRIVARYLLCNLPTPEEFLNTEWEVFEDMTVKVISVKTLDGRNQSEVRALYDNIEGFVGYIPEMIIGARMYLMHPNRFRSRIHTSYVMGHSKEGKIHTVTTCNSVYIFEEIDKEEST